MKLITLQQSTILFKQACIVTSGLLYVETSISQGFYLTKRGKGQKHTRHKKRSADIA
jgi:hypothetical protein